MYKETPLIKQYYTLKFNNPDCILFFQVGDFYEIFGYDAILCSRLLDLTLTKRNKNSIYLAGFPCNSLIVYINKLIKYGYKIAICDQINDNKNNKDNNLIDRRVTNIISPGISLYENINNNKNIIKFIAVLFLYKKNIGISLLDFSTGEFLVTEGNYNYIKYIIVSYKPKEFFIPKSQIFFFRKFLYNIKKLIINLLDDIIFNYSFNYINLLKHFNKNIIKKFIKFKLSIISAGISIYYIKNYYNLKLNHINKIKFIKKELFLLLDENTIKNLEIIKSLNKNGKSLLSILDNTYTSMGYRLLNNWIILPSKNLNIIRHRHNIINFFFKQNKYKNNLQLSILYNLKNIYDIEKLVSKISNYKITPNQLYKLSKSIKYINNILNILNINNIKIRRIFNFKYKVYNKIKYIYKIIKNIIIHNPINTFNKNYIIKNNISKKLDNYKLILKKKIYKINKYYINNIKKKINIKYLKFNKNDLIGYYFEIKKSDHNKIPNNWIIKQRLSNYIRYTTSILNKFEYYIYNLNKKIFALEKKIFDKIINILNKNIVNLKRISNFIAKIDVLFSLFLTAKYNKYVKPNIKDNYEEYSYINIIKGRHPVIEKSINNKYIPNNIYIDNKLNQIIIITGPNMSGKSAILRQTALIVIMAQMGSYVPAEYVELNIIDKIFSRIGATDNISKGESTFMLEMNETSYILNNFTRNSLILMDEIGRGTSTYDGISLSYSILKYLNNSIFKPKVLFTTHYYELKKILSFKEGIKYYNLSIKRYGNKLIFRRKLKIGINNNSYGIYIAEISGIPSKIIKDSKKIFNNFYNNNNIIIVIFKKIFKLFNIVKKYIYTICDSSS
ncbi:MAG: DNA mismatch repair protein MutS [Candidatus Shikimatogenerans bostrichidophilus]|nr:MAG: DNA mismatch repair protein MutS [Candidatus Shikimatogenerans bostrichidophilus]